MKKMNNELLFLSGNDVLIEEIQLLMHPPKIKDIAFIGEDNFFGGCELLRFDKDKLTTEDRSHLDSFSNFEILMSIMREKNPNMQKSIKAASFVLTLLFPTYDIKWDFENLKIIFIQDEHEVYLDKNNYDIFSKYLNELLCLDGDAKESDYNPSGSLASKIADKLKDRHAKLAQRDAKGSQKIAILSRYVSILAVGENKDMNSLLNYTIYQLFDEFKRFQLKEAWDIHIKSLLAGASAEDSKEVDDWMDDIHSNIEK